MKFCFLFVFSLVVALPALFSQPYVGGGRTRYSFAQTYLAADVQLIAGGRSSFAGADGTLRTTGLPAALVPRVTIGGLHFWGHADFYVTFPLGVSVLPGTQEGQTFRYRTGVETGARVFPWRIEQGRLRPFAGVAFAPWSYRQYGPGGRAEAPRVSRMFYPVQAGLVYGHKRFLLDAGVQYRGKIGFSYYLDRTRSVPLEAPAVTAWIGAKWYFDSSTGLEGKYPAIRRHDTVLARRGVLDNWSWGIGPSAAFFTRHSAYNRTEHPYLPDHFGTVFPELGLGYWWARPDVHVNLAARWYGSTRRAYGLEQRVRRAALTLEGYKFLGDYHGFAPFVGPCLSAEHWTVRERENGRSDRLGQWRGLRPGVVFGWDIRPFKRLNSSVLRTNLRYFPGIKLAMPGTDSPAMRLDQFEFNFIQMVFYPGKAARVNRMLK